jgi:hypothetical protein
MLDTERRAQAAEAWRTIAALTPSKVAQL